jgi:segregation and condensation protein A
LSLSIHIPQFEGPLGLLLYLIRKEEMDIFDIDVHLITSQYLEYIKKMKQFDLEVAGDFIAMAATLIQIKSRMLLPNHNDGNEEEEVSDDPRKELVQKLLEYQRFQEASKKLYERPLLGRDVFRRGKPEAIHTDEDGEIILDEGGLFAMIALYRNSIRKMKKAIHRVARKSRSIAGRILEMKDRFVVGQRLVMKDLITSVEDFKSELLITFLSCLELGKMGYVSVYQSEVYGDIYLTAKRSIDGDVVGRVEEYDSQMSESMADEIMEEAEYQASLLPPEESEETSPASDNESEMELSSLAGTSELEMDDMASDEDIALAEQELNLDGELTDESNGPREQDEV